jgi:hypothetical protein
VNSDGDLQAEYDKLYDVLLELLDKYYPERTVTISSADPPYVTPVVKHMLRQKNHLMRKGRIEEATALAVKIGVAINNYTSSELSRVDVLCDPRGMWKKVRQLTGRDKSSSAEFHNSGLTADQLNDHYAAVSNDLNYEVPKVKSTVNISSTSSQITNLRLFNILDKLRPTATGLDNIPAWFLKIGAPFFTAPLVDMLNLSLLSSVVPRQWKSACILPLPKVSTPVDPADFRPISITPVLSRVLERIVVTDYIYPSLQSPPPGLNFTDQFAFQPSASTTVAIIHLLHTITDLLKSNPYVIVYALDFSKAFDSVRQSAVLEKYSRLNLPDNIYNWVEAFFRGHKHCTRFGDDISQFRSILASIIQGSAIGPVSYVVTASDLHVAVSGNFIDKYADDTYLIIPSVNYGSCASEINGVERWAAANNLTLNRSKSVEMVFVAPRTKRAVVIPSPAVPGFQRVESMKILGVTFNRKFSVTDHVDHLLAACAQSLFALRTLRHHGLPVTALQLVFQATVLSKLSYASSAWWGFASAEDKARLEAFVSRCGRLGYRAASGPTLSNICAEADDRLFTKIAGNPKHLLRGLLPPPRDNHYELRDRTHNFILPARSTSLLDKNFISRLLFKNLNYSTYSQLTQ